MPEERLEDTSVLRVMWLPEDTDALMVTIKKSVWTCMRNIENAISCYQMLVENGDTMPPSPPGACAGLLNSSKP